MAQEYPEVLEGDSSNDVEENIPTGDLLKQVPGVNEKAGSDIAQHLNNLPLGENAPVTTESLYQYHSKIGFQEAYKVTRESRGRCFIINNEDFLNHEKRIGTNVDCAKLHKLFKDLGYIVTVYDNRSSSNILEDCRMFLLDECWQRCDSCVVCILSHGSQGEIIGKDSKPVKESEILDLFKDENCSEHLRGKPKLLIIQACRATIKKSKLSRLSCFGKSGVSADVNADDKVESDIQAVKDFMQKINQVNELNISSAAGNGQQDLVVAYSTVPGCLSFKDNSQGSWFIQALVHVFRRRSRYDHVYDMLVMVRYIVHVVFNGHQTPHTVSHLFKKFYFFEEPVQRC